MNNTMMKDNMNNDKTYSVKNNNKNTTKMKKDNYDMKKMMK